MSSSMNLHDVKSIKLSDIIKANGHAWQTVEIVMAPTVEMADGSWGTVRQVLSIALHCAEENRPIDVKVP